MLKTGEFGAKKAPRIRTLICLPTELCLTIPGHGLLFTSTYKMGPECRASMKNRIVLTVDGETGTRFEISEDGV